MTNQNCHKFCYKCGTGIGYDDFLLVLVTHTAFSSLKCIDSQETSQTEVFNDEQLYRHEKFVTEGHLCCSISHIFVLVIGHGVVICGYATIYPYARVCRPSLPRFRVLARFFKINRALQDFLIFLKNETFDLWSATLLNTIQMECSPPRDHSKKKQEDAQIRDHGAARARIRGSSHLT